MIFELGLFAVGYLIGTIPFAYLLTHWKNGEDIRDVGSGNIGATNAFRALGMKWAIVVFILDAAKGAVFVLLCAMFYPAMIMVHGPIQFALLAPIIGHCYPFYLGFRGGRGVATAGGVALAISPLSFIIAGLTYAIVVSLTKESFKGSLIALLVFLACDLFVFHKFWWLTLVLIAALLVVRHRTHIQKLFKKQHA